MGLSREEVAVNVVSEGRSGILGLGAEPAVVQVSPLTAPAVVAESIGNVAETAKGVLEKLLDLMGVPATVTSQANEGGEAPASITLNVSGEDLGILIGRRGLTLSSLQYVVRLMVSNQTKSREPILIDVEGYKERRYRNLEAYARQMAEAVKMSRKPFTFEPMSSFERRLIHVALSNDPDVTTESMGEGEDRKVVILPKMS
ncbi:MAG: RNA-binding cell elongation regulator Jag/EloR [Dehalococcoidales bacterium]|nr:RNA-binding cell elongation regulator Jag/EloR [Dehalococcoidales bacterium]